jgi:pimeloyl-[acyl-carrier protein] methyl ester esterase
LFFVSLLYVLRQPCGGIVLTIYTQTSGSGPDLVLIHGWGLHSGIWNSLLPLLEIHFRVTCIDLPGHGRSRWNGEVALDDMVQAVLAVAPPRAGWVGWSLGGLVALRAALLQPASVSALVLIASTPCFTRRPGWQSAMLPELLDTFAADLEQDYQRTLNRFLALQVRGALHATEALKRLRATLHAGGPPQLAGLHLQCPALLLMGERDTLVPGAAGRATARLLPHAQLAVIDAAGHAPFLSAPDVVANSLQRFLQDMKIPPVSNQHA